MFARRGTYAPPPFSVQAVRPIHSSLTLAYHGQSIVLPLLYRDVVLGPYTQDIAGFLLLPRATRPDLLQVVRRLCFDIRKMKASQHTLLLGILSRERDALLRMLPQLQSTSVFWSSLWFATRDVQSTTQLRIPALQVVLLGPIKTPSLKIPSLPSLSARFDLSVITRLEISAFNDAPWPAYLSPVSLPALTDLRFNGFEGSDLSHVQEILQSVGQNLRRLHLFCSEGLDASSRLDLPSLCPSLTDLGWNDDTCEAIEVGHGWPNRRLDSLLLNSPQALASRSRGRSKREHFDWLHGDISSYDWFLQAISLRPHTVIFGHEPDSRLWSYHGPHRARRLAHLLSTAGRDIKLEDSLGRRIKPHKPYGGGVDVETHHTDALQHLTSLTLSPAAAPALAASAHTATLEFPAESPEHPLLPSPPSSPASSISAISAAL